MLAWHFLREDGSTWRDSSYFPPLDGVEKHNGPLEICRSGLHGSQRVLDALRYAPGPIVRRVELIGKVIKETDKVCATERRELWRLDATEVLREFARWCAIGAVIGHWPNAPEVIRRWLATGNESLRFAAWQAATNAARDAAWDTAREATRKAIRLAAGNAVWDTAREAAWAIAKSTLTTAQTTAWATWTTIRAITQGNVWKNTWNTMNSKLEEMLFEKAKRRNLCQPIK